MSDVITTVKGQAATLSESENISFDLEELVKRIDILMKHELKNSLTYMRVQMNVPKETVINGDINSLVQVINNMISNSIQSYNGKTEQNIDLIFEKKRNNIIISVKDYGCGLPKKVQDKLFKEMITTKGKNGTGLGLYMSYSTIKAHFNGNITFETEEGKGTTFNITLPL
jgi:signal transduction histidine kinase